MFTKSTFKCTFTAVIMLFIFGCSNDGLNPDSEIQLTRASNGYQFNASLKGSNSVPANDSKGTGQIIVRISKDESKIHYKLITANIENVLFAHFHMAPEGQNGGVVSTLYFNETPQPSGPANGVLAEGYITSAEVSGSISGDLGALIEAIRSGNIYVNVHTTSYPPGELRGQL